MLSHKFSIVTVLDKAIPIFVALTYKYGLDSKLASVRSVDIPVLELENDLEYTQNKIVEQSVRAIKEDGAHAIIQRCPSLAIAIFLLTIWVVMQRD